MSCKLFIFIFAVFHIFSHVLALRCYTCSYVDPGTDRSCISRPEAVIGSKITNCAKKYCIIQRQELITPAGKVISFLRGCEEKPLILNGVRPDQTHKTYFRSCTTDLCNVGDGLNSNSLMDPNAGASENLIVKGISGCPARSASLLVLLINGLISLYVFNN